MCSSCGEAPEGKKGHAGHGVVLREPVWVQQLWISARALLSQVAGNQDVDCVGFNCGVGPYHMLQLLKSWI